MSYKAHIEQRTYTEQHTSITIEGIPPQSVDAAAPTGGGGVELESSGDNSVLQTPALSDTYVPDSASSQRTAGRDGGLGDSYRTGVAIAEQSDDSHPHTSTRYSEQAHPNDYLHHDDDAYASPGYPQGVQESNLTFDAQRGSSPPFSDVSDAETEYEDDYTSPGGAQLSHEQDLLGSTGSDEEPSSGPQIHEAGEAIGGLDLDGQSTAADTTEGPFDSQAAGSGSEQFDSDDFQSEDPSSDTISDTDTIGEAANPADEPVELAEVEANEDPQEEEDAIEPPDDFGEEQECSFYTSKTSGDVSSPPCILTTIRMTKRLSVHIP